MEQFYQGKRTYDLMDYVISNARFAIAVHDRELNYIYVSQRYLDVYRIEDRDVIGKHHYEVFPDLPQKWRDVHQRALKGEVISGDEDPYPREDGTVDWTRWECRPWYEENGEIGGIIVYTQIITDEKNYRDRLVESERDLKRAQKLASIGSWRFDFDHKCVIASQETYHIYGLEPREDGYLSIEDAQRVPLPEYREMMDQKLSDLIGKNEPYDIEFRIKRPSDGEIRDIHSIAEYDQEQNTVIGTIQDVTERRRLERQLAQAQKMESVGHLAGGVAHDFNNILQGMLGLSELMMRRLDEDSEMYRYVKEIAKGADKATALTRQLLAFARKQTIAPRIMDLNAGAEEMLKMLRRLIGEDIDLAWRPGHTLWHVKIDPSQVDQILANLCVNARDAIKGVGKITIETDNRSFDEDYCSRHYGFIPGEYVMLAVSDTGCGMEKSIQDSIFEPFFTTKTMGKGTGLGLATVYGIVKQNGGFINVYSEPDSGSTFKIYLPRHRGSGEMEMVVNADVSAVGNGERILLVEDDATIIDVIRKMLVELGYEVKAFNTPQKALDHCIMTDKKPDLLLTDVVMPEMTGKQLAMLLEKLKPGLRVLFMSGYTANVIAHRGVLDDGVNFIHKPFSNEDLAKKINQILKN